MFNLPDGAQTWQHLGIDSAWTVSDFLTARVVDAVRDGNWQRGGGKGTRPKPIPAPSEAKKALERQERVMDKAREFRDRQRQDREEPADG